MKAFLLADNVSLIQNHEAIIITIICVLIAFQLKVFIATYRSISKLKKAISGSEEFRTTTIEFSKEELENSPLHILVHKIRNTRTNEFHEENEEIQIESASIDNEEESRPKFNKTFDELLDDLKNSSEDEDDGLFV